MTVLEASAWHGGRLVGRERETTVLRRALDEVAAGTPGVVEISGEPGTGKTRLLVELAGVAQARGVRFIAAGSEYHVQAAIVDLLDGHLAGLASRLLVDLPVHRHASTIRALLGRLTQLPPLVLAIDDVHTADDEALGMVDQLLHSRLTGPVLLILTGRPRQLPAHVRRSLDETANVRQLQLAGLTAGEVASLIDRPPEQVAQLSLFRDSGGNPFYLKALLSLPGPNQCGADLAYSDVPPQARAPVSVELGALSARARQAAYAAAVLGEPVEPLLVAEVAQLPESDLRAAIDELVERDILRPGPDPGHLVFRHLVFRHLVYQDSPYGWRLGAHTRADRALRRRQAPVAQRAGHLTHTALTDGAEVLAEAAYAVAHRQPETAARWLLAALRPPPAGSGATVEECSVLLHRLCQAVGHWRFRPDRRQVLDEAIRLLPDRPSSLRLIVLAAGAELEWLLRRPARARQDARAGLATARGDDPADHGAVARLTLELACAYLSHHHAQSSHTHARQALAMAREHGDRAWQACAASIAAAASCLAGRRPTAPDEVRQAAAALNALPDTELARRPDAALWTGLGHLLLDRPQDALPHLDRAVEIDSTAEPHLRSVYLLIGRAIVRRTAGQLSDASRDAIRADRRAAACGSTELRALTAALQGWLSADLGDPYPADLGASTASRQSPGVDGPDLFATFERGMLAEARLAAGDHDGCLGLLEAADEEWVDPWSRVGWYELMTRAAVRAHRFDQADRWASQAVALAAELGTPGRHGLAALARAEALAVGDPLGAASLAAQAADALRRSGLGLDAARAHAVAGAALADAGKVDQALAELAVAAAQFGTSGARRLEREVADLRQRLSARTTRTRPPGPGVDTLTVREVQVATLVTRGMTNRQIAARLVVSEKTVEMHLSHTFVKLGVGNRAALVREMLLADRE